ncbi:hypothetical protein BTR14_16235 [Rhizobium rhizosphaerae]|uniref:DUF4167 domain-containing protein n=1 Tax=Xaviernesmea rhizosphaerae TaxID=1672749 RepID=A0ABX3PBD8_9HYPH|nr:DUF4167 domain-containing protein [Xaviernesmea rhizosphaerae]OQP85291.1 hypothetical protein BTR14_16235 [Xaviernesmea rhizosphaerae]
MRPGQQNKRGRGRNNNNNNGNNGGGNNHNRKGSNPLTRTYDSSGPDVKIRGTAQHIAEKYAALARDAQSAGDRVMAENYLQHAEHYNRIIAAAQAHLQERFQRDDRVSYDDRDYGDRDTMDGDDLDGGEDIAPTPVQAPAPAPVAQQPREVREPRERREPRQPRVPREPREPRVAAPAAVAAEIPDEQPDAVFDGTGPQPVIEGVPVEVAMEDEAAAAAPTRAASRRRGTPRPRRTRRSDAAEGGSGEGEGSAEPALAVTE